MSPNLTGVREQDEARSLELTKSAFQFSLEWLQRGGAFVTKVFEGRHTRG